uniref:aminotransferase class IV n=1 Tax=Marinospirillum sp. TaxID=2183934 RepID=UPI003A8AB754
MAFRQLLWTDGRPPAPEDLDWLLASRALAFGEGVFTSMRIWQGEVVFWADHLRRLRLGLAALRVDQPDAWWQLLEQEVFKAAAQQPDAQLKIMLLAGPGGRGYRRSATGQRWHRVLHLRPWVSDVEAYQGVNLWWLPCPGTAPESANKHLNRLCQVLASENCPPEYPEALLYTPQGWVVEAIARNVF